jgi:hypothetical protein
MSDPLSYVDEMLADADTFLQKKEDQGKAASNFDPNEQLADFLDKVAEAIEKGQENFDDESISLFVGENTNEDTLRLRESVKNRIQQLGSMGTPG